MTLVFLSRGILGFGLGCITLDTLRKIEESYRQFFREYSRYQKFVNFFGNMLLFFLAVYIVSDIQGFKDSIECKMFKPVIDVAMTCQYGVRADMCYTVYNATFKPYHSPIANFTNHTLNNTRK